jgi:FixJ family two-component response regulator
MDSASVRVAIVDDDPSVRRALKRLLRASGYDPSTYESGPAFLASVRSLAPACLVADFQMPDMTGLELHLHLVEAGIRIPTIVITAHDEADYRQRCVAAGIAAYLPKPLERDVVISAIRHAIRQAGAR